MTDSLLFGSCRITPTYSNDEQSGWQMTCRNPLHNVPGQARCTKSRTGNFEGGLEVALRMLKWWAVLGERPDVNAKQQHNKIWQAVVLRAHSAGSAMPTDEELDRQAPVYCAAPDAVWVGDGAVAAASSRSSAAPAAP